MPTTGENLLVVSPWFPFPPDNGSRQRAFYLLRELSRCFRIRLVTGVQDDSPPDVPVFLSALCEHITPIPWQWHDGKQATGTVETLRALVSPVPRAVRETPNPAMTTAIRAELARGPAAILAMERGIDAYLPDEAFAFPVVLDQVEVSAMETGSSLRQHLTGAKARQYWRKRLRRYHALTAVSEAEADAVRRVLGKRNVPRVVIVPNGVETNAYAPRNPQEIAAGRLLYNGALTYGPNREAVFRLVSDILPRVRAANPAAHLIVTGRYDAADAAALLPGIAERTVRLTGFLPDLRPELAKAGVCVVPLRRGGGTRLKILEAWAAGVPVVATSVGAAGLAGENETHLLVRDAPDAFADAVILLLRDPARGRALAAAARRLVEERYDWGTVAAPLVSLLTAR